MYKIMYNKFEGRVSRRPLNARLRSLSSRIQERIRELPDGNVLGRSTRRGWVPRHALSGFKITHIADHNGQLLKASWNGLRSYQINP